MQQDRNYRYAPVYSGGVSSGRRSASERTPDCRGNYPSDNGCGGNGETMVLAMAYVLNQPFENIYAPADGWKAGTIFMGLNLPYGGRSC